MNTAEDLDLVLERIVDITPDQIYTAWTTPELLKKWFAPLPWTTVKCELDLHPGGMFRQVMRSPDGIDYPNNGCFLELIDNKKIVWTTALVEGFRPSSEPLQITAIITLEKVPTGTKYTARVLHKSIIDKRRHEDMGFEKGWSQCLDQLVKTMKELQNDITESVFVF